MAVKVAPGGGQLGDWCVPVARNRTNEDPGAYRRTSTPRAATTVVREDKEERPTGEVCALTPGGLMGDPKRSAGRVKIEVSPRGGFRRGTALGPRLTLACFDLRVRPARRA